VGLWDRLRGRERTGRVEPSRPEEGDQAIVSQLRSLGADLSRPREVVHYLYLPTREAAEQAAEELRGEGYSVEVRTAAEGGRPAPNPWVALATIDTVVDEETVRAVRPRFEALAAAGSGEYDGWEAAAD
jgi:hypothetical protein